VKYIVRFFAVIGALVIFSIAIAAAIAVVSKKSLPAGKLVLEVNLEQGVVEYAPDNPLVELLTGRKPRLRQLIEALERASTDDHVVGLVAQIGQAPIGLAQIQELRDAVRAFRAKGKRAVAFSETFGEVGPGTGSYYLATAFDEIVMQPSGDVGLTGLISETPFIRGTFDLLDITPRFDHRYEYKNAMNMFTEKKFTPPHREALGKVLASMHGQIVRGIAQGRGLPADEVKSLIDRGPFLGQEAVTAKLVDRLAYRDEVFAALKQKNDDARVLYLAKYMDAVGKEEGHGATLALVHGVGPVTRGNSDFNPASGAVTMGSATVAGAIRAAAQDKDVKAILFRVDSPGGSYVASDTIWREVGEARKAGKPVIVSMGNVAGSGGYFVAMGADKIVAQPGTITGSIGVLGGKPVTEKAWEKIGITWDEVHFGANAGMWSGLKDYSPTEWARFEAWLDRVYGDFTSKVADGRKLPKEKVLQVAKGRIWSGEDAKALGLVDELGGYAVAIKVAREMAKIPADAKVQLKPFPAPKKPWQQFLEEGPDSSERGQADALVRLFEAVQPIVRMGQQVGLLGEPVGVLSMPEIGEIQ
jgi:protease-4